MVPRSRLLELQLGGSVDLSYCKINMLHAINTVASKKAASDRSTKDEESKSSSKDGSPGGRSATALSSGSSQMTAPSFSDGASAGWAIKIANDGPTIYHTGDTSDFRDFDCVNQFFSPSYVLLPLGT